MYGKGERWRRDIVQVNVIFLSGRRRRKCKRPNYGQMKKRLSSCQTFSTLNDQKYTECVLVREVRCDVMRRESWYPCLCARCSSLSRISLIFTRIWLIFIEHQTDTSEMNDGRRNGKFFMETQQQLMENSNGKHPSHREWENCIHYWYASDGQARHLPLTKKWKGIKYGLDNTPSPFMA